MQILLASGNCNPPTKPAIKGSDEKIISEPDLKRKPGCLDIKAKTDIKKTGYRPSWSDWKNFMECDVNQDGFITKEEFTKFFLEKELSG